MRKNTKKYEIALLYGSYKYDNVETYEYDTMKEMQFELEDFINNSDNDLWKIELSILEEDEDFESVDNLNSYCFCEIDINELRKGEELK